MYKDVTTTYFLEQDKFCAMIQEGYKFDGRFSTQTKRHAQSRMFDYCTKALVQSKIIPGSTPNPMATPGWL